MINVPKPLTKCAYCAFGSCTFVLSVVPVNDSQSIVGSKKLNKN